ncbi:ankyrin repeat-containing domain protein [Lasiosphaeria hispida]|uniref:Ankyrin repeat-containing domain protein n=1 Tax=Lasiosphaeria hispida TaxID=260671 RepID=A0AAJ0HJJ4_9PEZI|nr:ankyrin repeat-containing domain protein [Lasiosphaeria hispida]
MPQVEVDSQDKHSATPLTNAARRGDKAIVKLLLDTGHANANRCHDLDSESGTTPLGHTPLSNVAYSGHEAIVELLLAADEIDVNSKAWDGEAALIVAATQGHGSIVKLLLAVD